MREETARRALRVTAVLPSKEEGAPPPPCWEDSRSVSSIRGVRLPKTRISTPCSCLCSRSSSERKPSTSRRRLSSSCRYLCLKRLLPSSSSRTRMVSACCSPLCRSLSRPIVRSVSVTCCRKSATYCSLEALAELLCCCSSRVAASLPLSIAALACLLSMRSASMVSFSSRCAWRASCLRARKSLVYLFTSDCIRSTPDSASCSFSASTARRCRSSSMRSLRSSCRAATLSLPSCSCCCSCARSDSIVSSSESTFSFGRYTVRSTRGPSPGFITGTAGRAGAPAWPPPPVPPPPETPPRTPPPARTEREAGADVVVARACAWSVIVSGAPSRRYVTSCITGSTIDSRCWILRLSSTSWIFSSSFSAWRRWQRSRSSHR
mmetsp:Transcript_34083/g.80434  ORF Transcript_34083/g.80434 Transcript_34083/m.80434 type:complete len:378 (+) Transcript_34083:322-1455(+)